MVCLGFEPGTARWYTLRNPLCYGGPLVLLDVCAFVCFKLYREETFISSGPEQPFKDWVINFMNPPSSFIQYQRK